MHLTINIIIRRDAIGECSQMKGAGPLFAMNVALTDAVYDAENNILIYLYGMLLIIHIHKNVWVSVLIHIIINIHLYICIYIYHLACIHSHK